MADKAKREEDKVLKAAEAAITNKSLDVKVPVDKAAENADII